MYEMHNVEREINKGSVVIEMTLLIPIIIGCVYLYIIIFMFFIRQSEMFDIVSEKIYDNSINMEEIYGEEKSAITKDQKGSISTYTNKEQDNWFEYRVELRHMNQDPIKNLRRWQLVRDSIS